MNQVLRPLLVLFAFLTLLTGLAYPLLVTGIGRAFFSQQASGSLVMRDGVPVGSSLIGQSFQDPKYFWGRLSATSPMPNNGAASTGSNPATSLTEGAVPCRTEGRPRCVARAVYAVGPGRQVRVRLLGPVIRFLRRGMHGRRQDIGEIGGYFRIRPRLYRKWLRAVSTQRLV